MAARPKGMVIASEEDLLIAAASLEAAAARRYRYLAAWWEAQGERALTALFDRLAALEKEHVAAVLARRPEAGIVPLPNSTCGPPPLDDAAWRSALLTPYRALSLAVREEERAFAFYAEVAAHAATSALRALAEELARDELDHAAILRRARRAAYRDERAHRPPPPPADLAAFETRSAAWEAEVAAAAGRMARLRALSRNVERYLEIAEQTKSEAVLLAAQSRAAEALRRLAAARAGSDIF
jgi:rubrerythrin